MHHLATDNWLNEHLANQFASKHLLVKVLCHPFCHSFSLINSLPGIHMIDQINANICFFTHNQKWFSRMKWHRILEWLCILIHLVVEQWKGSPGWKWLKFQKLRHEKWSFEWMRLLPHRLIQEHDWQSNCFFNWKSCNQFFHLLLASLTNHRIAKVVENLLSCCNPFT